MRKPSTVLYHIGPGPAEPKPRKMRGAREAERAEAEWDTWLKEQGLSRDNLPGGRGTEEEPDPYPMYWWRKRRPGHRAREAVFLSPKPEAIANFHGIYGEVYAYRIANSLIAEAGGIQRYAGAPEIYFSRKLWEKGLRDGDILFLGKSMTRKQLANAVIEHGFHIPDEGKPYRQPVLTALQPLLRKERSTRLRTLRLLSSKERLAAIAAMEQEIEEIRSNEEIPEYARKRDAQRWLELLEDFEVAEQYVETQREFPGRHTEAPFQVRQKERAAWQARQAARDARKQGLRDTTRALEQRIRPIPSVSQGFGVPLDVLADERAKRRQDWLYNQRLWTEIKKEGQQADALVRQIREEEEADRKPNPWRVGPRKPYTTLHMYDFDGTLFRSPDPPPGHSGSWWSNYASLSEPVVPRYPDTSWWVPEAVTGARRSIADPDVYAAVITGRTDQPDFNFRIAELLDSNNLEFDGVFLKEGRGSTLPSKLVHLRRILQQNPTIRDVVIWEDRKAHMDEMVHRLRKAGLNASGRLIVAERKKPAGTRGRTPADEMPPRKKVLALQLVLTGASQRALLDAFPARHSEDVAHHVTVAFKPSADEYEAFLNEFAGQPVPVQVPVLAVESDDKAQAAVVDVFSFNERPHITISYAKDRGVRPVYSNELLAKMPRPTNRRPVLVLEAYPVVLLKGGGEVYA
jgi:hypothetical protein